MPRIYITPPTPTSYAFETTYPWLQLASQIYISTSLGLGALAATGLLLAGAKGPYVTLGATALAAGSIGVTLACQLQGRLRHASKLQWPLAAAHGAALGAALAPVLGAYLLQARPEPSLAAWDAVDVPISPTLVTSAVTCALAIGAACGNWRRLARALHRDGAADSLNGMPVNVWGFAAVACGALAVLAGAAGTLADDDALTGVGCVALLGVPATLAACLATAPRQPSSVPL